MENQKQEIIEEKEGGVESVAAAAAAAFSVLNPSSSLLNSTTASTNHYYPGYTKLPLLHPLPSSLQGSGSVSGFSALNPEPKEGSRPSALQETAPSTRGHKKMEERIEEINQLCNQLLRDVKESKDQESVIKDQNLTEVEEPTEKDVWYEKQGDFLIFHFRCPCKKCYAILLGENGSYYKLTSL